MIKRQSHKPSHAMQITVKYFASLRESIGRHEEEIVVNEPAAVADVWRQLGDRYKHLPESILCAVNQNYAFMDTQLVDGDELAFFPPVTGG